ncbi:hypothetical protein TNCT_669841 [Trichonephila clavata]|uniref:Uncharacterized protein n=1 Tax=Trichonephila clavata TaxID=2740835 RepID=A0A8X6GHW7_TRICU|nr:hypothetical protein TNCT_669841 [Trichonephila clavata]
MFVLNSLTLRKKTGSGEYLNRFTQPPDRFSEERVKSRTEDRKFCFCCSPAESGNEHLVFYVVPFFFTFFLSHLTTHLHAKRGVVSLRKVPVEFRRAL